MRVWKVAMSEEQYMKPVTIGKNKREYPISRALKQFKHCAKMQGITKAGKKILKEVASEQKAKQVAGGKAATPTPGDNAEGKPTP